MYASKIELDVDGNVIKGIGFPKVEINSPQESIVPLQTVKEKAHKRGFYIPHQTQTAMAYDPISNILVWKFINETFKEDHTFITEELMYNAHNGNFIKTNVTQGEWIE